MYVTYVTYVCVHVCVRTYIHTYTGVRSPFHMHACMQDGNTFCTSLTPRLFSIDLSIPEHKVFFNEVGLGVGQEVVRPVNLAVLVYVNSYLRTLADVCMHIY